MGLAETAFGLRVKDLRQRSSQSQEDLAYLADIHVSYVSQIERGLKSPSLGVILAIARGLGTPVTVLVTGLDELA